jgi:hypothetical protein
MSGSARSRAAPVRHILVHKSGRRDRLRDNNAHGWLFPATNPIIAVAYLGSFNPANLCTNYLGDPGGSPNPTNSFSVNVPAGGTLFVNVHEINPGLLGCSAYTLTVSGLFCNTPGAGECVPCTINCPSNVVQPNDPNQCGAVVNYPAPTSNGTCGVVTCSLSARQPSLARPPQDRDVRSR